MDLSQYENTYHDYGQCPNCSNTNQPDGLPPYDVEYCNCCECQISWVIHRHDRECDIDTDEKYLITDIESFADMLVTPPECD